MPIILDINCFQDHGMPPSFPFKGDSKIVSGQWNAYVIPFKRRHQDYFRTMECLLHSLLKRTQDCFGTKEYLLHSLLKGTQRLFQGNGMPLSFPLKGEPKNVSGQWNTSVIPFKRGPQATKRLAHYMMSQPSSSLHWST